MNKINSIFSECEEWENTPIGEIFEQKNVNINQKIKRVIVYGATQMGKTTMIMNLIGIKDEKKAELSATLRGMSTEGNSSTSTPIIYNQWNSSYFGIAMGDEMNETEGTLKKYSTKDDFIKAISSINEQQRTIGQNDTTANNVRYYYIPKDFFNEGKRYQDIQIIDLPGFGEKNIFMYEKTEEITQRLINFVAGAVVVIKAEKIVNLENEYKHFLKKNHTNHLAISITHALSVDSELKKQISEKKGYFEKCKTANDYSDAIVQYFYDKLTDEKSGYISKEKYPIEVIFPVEKSDEIKKVFPSLPELVDAFDIILQKLINRMESMTNTAPINACIERLQEEEKLNDENLEDEKNNIEKLKNQKAENEKASAKNKKIIKENKSKQNDLQHKMTKLKNDAKLIAKNISDLSEKRFENTDDYVSIGLVRHYVKVDKLLEEFEIFFSAPFKQKNSPLKKDFDKRIRQTISDMDFGEVTKKYFYRTNAIASIYALFKIIQIKLCGGKILFCPGERVEGELIKLLNENESKETRILQSELEKIDEDLLSLNDIQRIYTKNINDVSSKINLCNENIKKLNKRKNVISKNKVEVINIFTDHFFEKEKDLLNRMEKETDPELTTALFLTYSAIYLNIKPYFEEEHNE